MDLDRPILLFDNKCFACTKFAKIVNRLSRGWIQIIGHYDNDVLELRNEIFHDFYDPTQMFWMIHKGYAYGSRAGLVRVVTELCISLSKKRYPLTKNYDVEICDYSSKTNPSCSILKRIVNLIKISENMKVKNRKDLDI
jgi:hypothetical protein